MSESASTWRRRRSYSPLFWGVWAILVGVAVVAITSTGVDVLAVVTICVVLLALERTLGDWLGEFLGSGLASLVFAAVVVLVAWYAAGARDRSEIQSLACGRRGPRLPALLLVGTAPLALELAGQRGSADAAATRATQCDEGCCRTRRPVGSARVHPSPMPRGRRSTNGPADFRV